MQAKERACGELNDKCSEDILADDEEFYRHAEKERGGMLLVHLMCLCEADLIILVLVRAP